MLGEQYYENKKYADYFNANFIMFRADNSKDDGKAIFTKYSIRATPTVMFLANDGAEVDWIVGFGGAVEKYHEQVDNAVKGKETFKSYSDQYKKDPKNIPVIFNLAKKYDSRYNQDKAAALYAELIALDPNGKLGTTEYGKEKVSYTQFAEFQVAGQTLRGAKINAEPMKAFLKKYGSTEMAKSGYQRLSSYYMSTPRNATPEDSAKHSVEAKKFFEDYLAKYPDDPMVLSAVVRRIIRSKENLDKGIELAQKAVDLPKNGSNSQYVSMLAELYMLKADQAKAEEVYGKDFISRETSMYQYALSTYANFWANQGKNLEGALDAAKKVVTMNPSASAYMTLANIYVKNKQLDEAKKAGEKAIELAPEAQKAMFKTRLETIMKVTEIK
ncbi:MAG: tetratricopeptide repeat protein [bacterium]